MELKPFIRQENEWSVPTLRLPWVADAGLPQSQEAQQIVGFEGCFEAFGLDTAFAGPWSAQEGQGEVAEGDPVLTGIGQFDL